MKLGDLYPRLRELPGYEEMAESEAEGVHATIAASLQETPRYTLDASHRLMILRRECPHGSKPEDCGCADELICALGRGRNGRPNREECYACLQIQK
jgi:hypothetical protein